MSKFITYLFILSLQRISSIYKKQMNYLRLMTYNIHYGNNINNEYNIKEIAEVIKESKAELICLQEIDNHWGSRSNYENLIEMLSEITGFNYFYAPIYDKPSQRGSSYPNEQFGVGFLSKYEIIKSYNYNISRWSTQKEDPQPGDKDFPPKKGGFGYILINKNGKLISVYNTHLDYRASPPSGYKKSIREIQVKEMLKIMNINTYPTILMGDMNTDRSSKEVFEPLLQFFNDAWPLGNKGNGYSFPSNNPTSRIDYILTSKNIIVKKGNLMNTTASDHLPVIIDIELQ